MTNPINNVLPDIYANRHTFQKIFKSILILELFQRIQVFLVLLISLINPDESQSLLIIRTTFDKWYPELEKRISAIIYGYFACIMPMSHPINDTL